MSPRDLATAGGTWVVAVGALAAVPALAAGDPSAETPGFDSPAWWACAVLVTVQAVLLLGVRRWPRAVLVAVALPAPVAAILGSDDATGTLIVAVVVAVFLTSTREPLERLWPALGAATALVAAGGTIGGVATGLRPGEAVALSLAQAVGTLGLTLLVAVVVATRRESQRARLERMQALEREQDALVQAAVARERTAMARELHDIAAHHLSGISVMAAAIGTQVETDPAGARDAAQEVRQQSTAVLRDLRRLVGLLREDDGTDARPETLAGIAALAADATGDVTLTVLRGTEPGTPGSPGTPGDRGVGPLAQLAAYRTVQESLANATRHAPGAPVEVVVDERGRDAVVVTVTNDAAPAAPEPGPDRDRGFGLLGMRERAELTGADLATGPTPEGGWRVTLRLPRDRTDDTTHEEVR